VVSKSRTPLVTYFRSLRLVRSGYRWAIWSTRGYAKELGNLVLQAPIEQRFELGNAERKFLRKQSGSAW
jgi:hypothetical protein